jgi:RimJ/RimL family protein N-acetyltransferase
MKSMESVTNNPFHSERLSYRAYRSPVDDQFFYNLQDDPIASQNSGISLPMPIDDQSVVRVRKQVLDNALLFVVICRKSTSPTSKEEEAAKSMTATEPIGFLFLTKSGPGVAHHRCTELGIDIQQDFQGQGYGTEAIQWALVWAFRAAGLHRVELRVLGWNQGARKLYERLGFREEGRRRKAYGRMEDGGTRS